LVGLTLRLVIRGRLDDAWVRRPTRRGREEIGDRTVAFAVRLHLSPGSADFIDWLDDRRIQSRRLFRVHRPRFIRGRRWDALSWIEGHIARLWLSFERHVARPRLRLPDRRRFGRGGGRVLVWPRNDWRLVKPQAERRVLVAQQQQRG